MFLKPIQLTSLLYVLLCVFASAAIAETKLKTINDLRELKQKAEDKNLSVLILFTAEDCDYCDIIRENYLIPMIKSGDYTSKTLFRQIYIEDYSYLRNQKGELVGGDQIALKYDVDVTPTILFVDADFKELTKRIIGIKPAYFSQMLDSSISQASNITQSRK